MMRENLEETLFQTAAAEHWQRFGVQDRHGINLPLSSLHTENSCGIGEYLDLIQLFPWMQRNGLSILQLLPINDMGLGTSPYDAISSNALNPIFLSLHSLPEIGRIPDFQEKLEKIRYWTRTPRVKFHIVRELKNVFFKEYIPAVAPAIISSNAYKEFVEKHKDWLLTFALFKALKQAHFWKRWSSWPVIIQHPTPEMLDQLARDYEDQVEFHKILQYLCFSQMKQVKHEAEKHHIFIKGDLPILINKDSADVWSEKRLFHLQIDAGAPPDMYVQEGQHWGFPLYNWEEMERSNYQWWKKRLSVSSELYHLYRIDHVVGFFRIWGITPGKPPREGRFYPDDEKSWIPHGKAIMKMMLENSLLLPIGEDLGVVPESVKDSLTHLGICGTKLMRWERRQESDNSFIDPKEYNPLSMTTVSTHDSDTLQLWWRHYPKEAKEFCEFKGWEYRPFLDQERLKEILKDAHHSNSLLHVNLLNEYLALFPNLISHNPGAERINIPGKILDTNWTYRFIPKVEEIVSNSELEFFLKEILEAPKS